ncbi:MAG: YraN family protein [Longimicrobiales bacterium]
MAASHDLGRDAERAVADFLRSAGWAVLASNWRFGHKEIDLIVRRAGVVAFVEVKCRTAGRFGSPAEAVTASKRRDLALAAKAWMGGAAPGAQSFRFDVCSVSVGAGGTFRIEHIEDAWRL